jgi:hypothetical protein
MDLHRNHAASLVAAIGLACAISDASASPPAMSVQTPASLQTNVAAHCWWRHGVRHCRWYGNRYYGYRSRHREYNDPDAYPTGSSHWWQEMDRLDRGGRRIR